MDPEVCLNCHASLKGAYCSECGQAASTQRLRFPELVRDFAGQVFSLDSKILHTCLALLRRPGPFIRDYLQGRRARYAGPLSYYVLAVALNLASAVLLGRAAANPVNLGPGSSFWKENFVALQVGLVLALFMLPLAVMRQWLHRRAGYSVAEHMAALLFVLAQSILIFLALQMGLWAANRQLVSGRLEGLVFFVIFTAYLLWASRRWLIEPAWKVGLKLLGSYGAILFIMLGAGLVGIVAASLSGS